MKTILKKSPAYGLFILLLLISCGGILSAAERNPSSKSKPDRDYVIVSSGYENMTVTQFPDICRLKDGRLFVAFYAGNAHVTEPDANCPKGGAICACYSSDEGRSWTELKTIIDTDQDDRDPSVVQLEDGRLLCNFFTVQDKGNNEFILETKLCESADSGKTWSEPVTIYPGYATSSPIRVLSDGSLLIPLYRSGNDTAWGGVGRSFDQGKTWEPAVDIPRGEYRLDAETDVIERKDGSLYAIERCQMAYSISEDGGKTWSVSQDVGFPGEAPYLFRTPKGIVLMTLREEGKTTLRISCDDCTTWSDAVLVDDCQGAYPSIVTLKDGSLLIVYYEGGTTYPNSKIRAKRFSVNSNGKIIWKRL